MIGMADLQMARKGQGALAPGPHNYTARFAAKKMDEAGNVERDEHGKERKRRVSRDDLKDFRCKKATELLVWDEDELTKLGAEGERFIQDGLSKAKAMKPSIDAVDLHTVHLKLRQTFCKLNSSPVFAKPKRMFLNSFVGTLHGSLRLFEQATCSCWNLSLCFSNNCSGHELNMVIESFGKASKTLESMSELLLKQSKRSPTDVNDLNFSSMGEKAVQFWANFRVITKAMRQPCLDPCHDFWVMCMAKELVDTRDMWEMARKQFIARADVDKALARGSAAHDTLFNFQGQDKVIPCKFSTFVELPRQLADHFDETAVNGRAQGFRSFDEGPMVEHTGKLLQNIERNQSAHGKLRYINKLNIDYVRKIIALEHPGLIDVERETQKHHRCMRDMFPRPKLDCPVCGARLLVPNGTCTAQDSSQDVHIHILDRVREDGLYDLQIKWKPDRKKKFEKHHCLLAPVGDSSRIGRLTADFLGDDGELMTGACSCMKCHHHSHSCSHCCSHSHSSSSSSCHHCHCCHHCTCACVHVHMCVKCHPCSHCHHCHCHCCHCHCHC